MERVRGLTRPDGSEHDTKGAARILAAYVAERPGDAYELTIGTDSQNFERTKFVEAVVLRRIGSGGIFFYRVGWTDLVRQLRTKIYEETQRSLELAGALLPAFRAALEEAVPDADALRVHAAIHCDIGMSGETRSMLKEIAGWVESQGYDCMIKPESYAASGVANRISK